MNKSKPICVLGMGTSNSLIDCSSDTYVINLFFSMGFFFFPLVSLDCERARAYGKNLGLRGQDTSESHLGQCHIMGRLQSYRWSASKVLQVPLQCVLSSKSL